MTAFRIGMLGILLVAGSARATERPRLLDQAILQIQHLEERAALANLERALTLPDNTPRVLAEIYLYIGLANAGLSKHDEAVSAFASGLVLDSMLTLPPDSSPKILAWWEEAQAKVLRSNPPHNTPIRVTSEPTPAWEPNAVIARKGEDTRSRGPRWAPWVVAGAGLAAVAVGTVMGLQGTSLERASQNELSVGASSRLHQQAVQRGTAANVLWAVGGAGFAGGTAWWVWQRLP